METIINCNELYTKVQFSLGMSVSPPRVHKSHVKNNILKSGGGV